MTDTNKIEVIDLEEYIKGVVAAEMPAEFELEALKAQAVAARTYAVKNMLLIDENKGVNEAHITSSEKTDQAFQNKEKLKQKWDSKFDDYYTKIAMAVNTTRGLILTYDNKPIEAYYHSTSGEKTASAKEVWGNDLPYLQSVPCTWDTQSSRYLDNKEFSLKELENKLNRPIEMPASINNQSLINILERTDSGRVAKVKIGDTVFSGQQIRELLNLRSTNFNFDLKENKVLINTVGYGHGVGMCQYGANGQAKEGRSFKDILTYYYRDTKLTNIKDIKELDVFRNN